MVLLVQRDLRLFSLEVHNEDIATFAALGEEGALSGLELAE